MGYVKFNYKSDADFDRHINAVKIEDDEVQKYVDSVVNSLLRSLYVGNDDFSFCASGDTFVFGYTYAAEGDINIIVCRNYEQAMAWLDENGNIEKMNWMEDENEGYLRNLSKEELIDIIREQRKASKPYNPHKEV